MQGGTLRFGRRNALTLNSYWAVYLAAMLGLMCIVNDVWECEYTLVIEETGVSVRGTSYQQAHVRQRATLRFRSEEDREAHNLKVRGSKPRVAITLFFVFFVSMPLLAL